MHQKKNAECCCGLIEESSSQDQREKLQPMTHAHLKVLEEPQSSSSIRKILCFHFALAKRSIKHRAI
jgi:hypothetical protein